jgi:hypothetical protein
VAKSAYVASTAGTRFISRLVSKILNSRLELTNIADRRCAVSFSYQLRDATNQCRSFPNQSVRLAVLGCRSSRLQSGWAAEAARSTRQKTVASAAVPAMTIQCSSLSDIWRLPPKDTAVSDQTIPLLELTN